MTHVFLLVWDKLDTQKFTTLTHSAHQSFALNQDTINNTYIACN